MTKFVPGLELNRAFYSEIVAPLVAGHSHAAGRLGWGSEVLGFDTERSTDHGWGPHLVVFVDQESVLPVTAAIERGLPETFGGWPVRYGWDSTPVTHHVIVTALGPWLVSQLGSDVREGLATIDWLLVPQQKLLETTAGALYHDGCGELTRLREQLAWYPDDVWQWMIAAQWRRIGQEEAFVGRTAEVGDDLGSRLVTARICRELMRMWFLFARSYWPYSKWFGSAFAGLQDSSALGLLLGDVLSAPTLDQREAALAAAYEVVANRHNDLGLTEEIDAAPRTYYSRPFRVLMAGRFVDACLEGLAGSPLADLPLVGSVDQLADSTDLLQTSAFCRRIAAVYQPGEP